MATIGIFAKTSSGFTGTIQTMGLEAKVAIGRRVAARLSRLCGQGAGWARTGKGSGREFVSVKLDDPSFAAPIYANHLQRDGQHDLIWSR